MAAATIVHDTSEAVELCPSYGLYLKPITKMTISVALPQLKQPGKSISNWEVMERLKGMVQHHQFSTLRISKSTMDFIRFEGEVENRSLVRSFLACLDGKTIKLSGFSDILKVRAAEFKIDFPTRHDWDSFFRDAKDMNETLPGERPDTIHLEGLPCKWFAQKESGSEKPSEEVLVQVFEKFGEIRNVDIPMLDPYREEMTGRNFHTFSFGGHLNFEAYVQYREYVGFIQAMSALRGMKLMFKGDDGKAVACSIKVSFDSTKHLSDASIKKRQLERQKLQELERQREAQKRREKEAEERQRAEERGLAMPPPSLVEEPRGRRRQHRGRAAAVRLGQLSLVELELSDRKQKALEELERERKREEKLRRREQKQRERESRRSQRKLQKLQAEEQRQLHQKIRLEERRLLLAQRNLQSLRLVAELLSRAKRCQLPGRQPGHSAETRAARPVHGRQAAGGRAAGGAAAAAAAGGAAAATGGRAAARGGGEAARARPAAPGAGVARAPAQPPAQPPGGRRAAARGPAAARAGHPADRVLRRRGRRLAAPAPGPAGPRDPQGDPAAPRGRRRPPEREREQRRGDRGPRGRLAREEGRRRALLPPRPRAAAQGRPRRQRAEPGQEGGALRAGQVQPPAQPGPRPGQPRGQRRGPPRAREEPGPAPGQPRGRAAAPGAALPQEAQGPGPGPGRQPAAQRQPAEVAQPGPAWPQGAQPAAPGQRQPEAQPPPPPQPALPPALAQQAAQRLEQVMKGSAGPGARGQGPGARARPLRALRPPARAPGTATLSPAAATCPPAGRRCRVPLQSPRPSWPVRPRRPAPRA
ncbi:A-kinase anchor protein 17A isoform X1 [Marmota monax]|uniref:A-kinase anchor protein 17A isoform X1 n=1 Tax=Marmota monax TaxID=9995 RepID=UPI001EB0181B|nr:A-kinase anchor protein 17A isoform X1 [Marmota monax]XP_046299385.1 A-kinase anchor protein 17A isoform X1 [Marmota monax]